MIEPTHPRSSQTPPSCCRAPRGPRVAVLTNGGGLILAPTRASRRLPPPSEETREALAARSFHARQPGEPDRPARLGDRRHITRLRSRGACRPGLDSLIMTSLRRSSGAEEVGTAVAPRSRAVRNDKPVLAAFVSADGTPQSLVDASVTTFSYPESAARALGRRGARQWLRRPAGTTTPTWRAPRRRRCAGCLRARAQK